MPSPRSQLEERRRRRTAAVQRSGAAARRGAHGRRGHELPARGGRAGGRAARWRGGAHLSAGAATGVARGQCRAHADAGRVAIRARHCSACWPRGCRSCMRSVRRTGACCAGRWTWIRCRSDRPQGLSAHRSPVPRGTGAAGHSASAEPTLARQTLQRSRTQAAQDRVRPHRASVSLHQQAAEGPKVLPAAPPRRHLSLPSRHGAAPTRAG